LSKTLWLTAIFLHLPVRAEALRAALGTAGHHSLMKGFALHPFCDGGNGEHLPYKPQFEILPKSSPKIRANLTNLRKLSTLLPIKYSKLPKMRKGDKKSAKKVAFSHRFVV
jgi:hypothetical protein